MKAADRLATSPPYLAWGFVSTVLLAATYTLDREVFSLTVYGAAGVSIVLISLSLLFNGRVFAWALLSALPTLLAFVVAFADRLV